MRFLLDTHVVLWAQADRARLGPQLEVLEDPAHERLVSAASSWEIAVKVGVGRLALPEPPERWVPTRLRAMAATLVAVEHDHALRVAALPPHHRDPFDRLLVAQAQALDVPIMTADPLIGRYEVEVLAVAPSG